ncbi:MAG: hypothetical protein PHD48_07865 [Alphaproteobacteria bacterium]|nr:hypothetical protein [Alphaproteobacteria bacterium]
MKRFSCAKSLTVLFALAAQIFLPAFHSHALATPFSLAPEKFPQPPAKTLLASPHSPFAIQVKSVVIQHTSTAQAEARLKKLGEALKKNVRRNLKTKQPKAANKSVGKCAHYSVLGINAAGIKLESADSRDLPQKLRKAGFKIVHLEKNETPRPADVLVISPPNDVHHLGHTSVFGPDRKWYADFAQKGAWPYGDVKRQESLMTYFRHDAFSAVEVQTEFVPAYHVAINPAYFMRDTLLELDTPWKIAHPKRPNAADWLAGTLKTNQESLVAFMPTTERAFIELTTMPCDSQKDTPFLNKKNPRAKQPHLSSKKAAWTREELAYDTTPSNTDLLHAQWHEARKAVLQRNKALKQGTSDPLAENKLHASLKKMNDCVADVMKSNPVAAFKAMRYICNKYDESNKGGGDNRLASIDKQKLLSLISKNLGKISNADEDLGRQAANYVIKKAGQGPLRESVRAYVAYVGNQKSGALIS